MTSVRFDTVQSRVEWLLPGIHTDTHDSKNTHFMARTFIQCMVEAVVKLLKSRWWNATFLPPFPALPFLNPIYTPFPFPPSHPLRGKPTPSNGSGQAL